MDYNYISKNKREGESRVMNNGMAATIIAYRSSHDIDIQFEDGTVIKNRAYRSFESGHIRNPKIKIKKSQTNSLTGHSHNYHDRKGERRVMNNGMTATIIAYRSSHDIDIQFEDGIVIKNRAYRSFKNGRIAHPNIPSIRTDTYLDKKEREGERRVMNNGMTATIIAYRKSRDIDIQFEDGAVREHVRYDMYKIGRIAHPNNINTYLKKEREGERRVMNNGMAATIIAYRSSLDIDIQFEDGTVREHVQYISFKRGELGHPLINNRSKKGKNRCTKLIN